MEYLDEQKIKLRTGILVVLALIAIVTYWPIGERRDIVGASVFESFDTGECEEGLLCVIFFDVGQGDAIYIESPSGIQMLIDGGRDSTVLRKLGHELDYFDRTLDYVLATHPDADHVAGLVDVLKRYDVEAIILSGNEGDTPVADAFVTASIAEDAQLITARRGQTIDLGAGVVFEILFPDRDVRDVESNTASIVAKLTYGDTEFLLTGDAPKSIEEYLVLAEGAHLQSDVLKVGHHGSRTSTSELFLAEVAPQYAVISAGQDNKFGHPHTEVTDLLFNYGVQVKSTAQSGDVVFMTDGVDIYSR